MDISHILELPDGSVKFQGTLEGPELAIVMEAGLNVLLQQGAIPFLSKEQYAALNVVEDESTYDH